MKNSALTKARHIWHYIWATIFNIFNIESTQMFTLRAKIIHISTKLYLNF